MIRAFLASLALALPAAAQEATPPETFSDTSEAREWGLYAEVKARFDATVVDALCELTGECADDCGGGDRQLALVRDADDALVMPLKNNQPAFTGAAVELLPFCGQAVEVDGLLIHDPEIGAVNVYLVQRIRLREDGAEWVAANQWTEDWAENHPDAAGEGPWFRRDPRVLSRIEEEGYLGLGQEVDEAFIADWF